MKDPSISSMWFFSFNCRRFKSFRN